MDTHISHIDHDPGAPGRWRSRKWLLAIAAIAAAGATAFGVSMALIDSGDETASNTTPAASTGPSTTIEAPTAEPFVPGVDFIRDISLALTELAVGTDEAQVDAIFGHPALLTAAQGEAGASEESIVIFVNEDIHEDTFSTERPTVWLRVDGSDRLEPSSATTTRSDIHHRTVRFEWDVPGLSPLSELIHEEHRLALLIEPVSPGNTIVWDLPLAFSSGIESVIEQMNESPVVATDNAVSIGDFEGMSAGDISDGTAAVMAAIDERQVVTFEIELTETGFQPSALFVPADQMVQFILSSSAAGERHFQVPGMTAGDLQWVESRDYEVEEGITEAEHVDHHELAFVAWRAPSDAGISPTGDELHAYVQDTGGRDVVRFVAAAPGVYRVVDPLRPEITGELEVYR